MKGFLLSV